MARSPLFDRVKHLMRIARACDEQGISTREGLQRAAEAHTRAQRTRREFLGDAGKAAAAAGLLALTGKARSAFGAPSGPTIDVGIVGAGLAGLACGDVLANRGVIPTFYEARDRVGGRCWSERTLAGFEGQVFERGGELIDNPHKTMLGYANRFGLAKELQWKVFDGEETFYFNGRTYSSAEVIDAYRVFFDQMKFDLQATSYATTADYFTEADRFFDNLPLRDYFNGGYVGLDGTVRPGMPTPAREVYSEAYLAEYGLELDEQSTLNFMYFAKASRRSKFQPFGNFSDERYHLLNGNDGVATGLHGVLTSAGSAFKLGYNLTRMRKRPDGKIELTFLDGNRTVTAAHEAVVVTLPFSVLRHVELDASLELPAWKTYAINEMGYGNNAKTMIRFNGRPWAAHHSIGVSYSDLANHQATWETNPTNAGAKSVLTDYSSGDRGYSLSVAALQSNVDKFLTDLNKVWPGSKAQAVKSGGKYVAHLQHWPSDPFSRGSYTCYKPGEFTTIAGNEGKPVKNLFFAGEHTDSFYSWQGFMEGACLSGITAGNAVLAFAK
jgi:monoamine oxidase